MNTEPVRYAYAIPGQSSQSVYYQKLETPPPDHVLMESERPLDGDYIASEEGTWQPVIDNSIFVTNGQARQDRIKREQQQKIKAEALALKRQVETLNTMVMNEV